MDLGAQKPYYGSTWTLRVKALKPLNHFSHENPKPSTPPANEKQVPKPKTLKR